MGPGIPRKLGIPSIDAAVVSGVGSASMFDTVDFQHRPTPVECAGESILSDAKFRERSTGWRLEELGRFAPLGINHSVELRNDAVLHVQVR